MASAAPAYSYPSRQPQRSPRISVLEGGAPRRQSDGLPASVIMLARVAAIFFVVFALLGFARIALASATVTTAVASNNIISDLETARSTGNTLEVKESHLASPSNLKAEAAKLGMSKVEDVYVMALPADVVYMDEAGNLSLALSLRVASQG